MNDHQLALYEREVEARERQADALERIAKALNVNAHDNEYGIENIAEAVAMLVRVAAFKKENDA